MSKNQTPVPVRRLSSTGKCLVYEVESQYSFAIIRDDAAGTGRAPIRSMFSVNC